MSEKLRVMIVTYFPWDTSLSTGNTISNIFEGLEDKIEFANIYIQDGKPNNTLCEKYFCISQKKMIRNILSRKPVGEVVDLKSFHNENESTYEFSYNKVRQLRWNIFLLIQDLIGLFANWKSKDLNQFVSNFSPDIIFGPLGRTPITNKIMVFLHNKFNLPIIAYPWDDHYSLKKKSFSIFFWIKTFIERQAIKECALESEFLYTITKQMKKEYSSYFNKKCKILTKTKNFSQENSKTVLSNPIRIVYLGNIGGGRCIPLLNVIKCLRIINQNKIVATLTIYTATPISRRMKKKLSIYGTSTLENAVPNSEVSTIMKSADILLHVVPTKNKERLLERLSFSTKIVDYFFSARCILAVGGESSTMKYLRENDAAIIATENELPVIKSLLEDKDTILNYGNKAWKCGVANHQKKIIQNMIIEDFERTAKKGENNEL